MKKTKEQTGPIKGPIKAPLDEREYPLARGSRGKASREELRQKTPLVSPPRQGKRPVERSRQRRTHS